MSQRRIHWDTVGGWASSLCAVHCVMTGLAMGFLSTFGLQFLASATTEIVFLSLALLAGGFAIAQGRKRHGKWWPATLFAAGMGLIVARHQMFPHAHSHDHAVCCTPPLVATIMSVGGGLMLVGFHVLNAWMSHQSVCSLSPATSTLN